MISDIPKNSQNGKTDKTLLTLLKIGITLLFFGLVIIIYLYMFNKNEPFTQSEIANPTIQPGITELSNITTLSNKSNTVYENALNRLYPDNPRMICSLLPSNSNICNVGGESYIKYNFPVHMIKLLDASILAVFNDGRLYKKDNINNSMWLGPLNNSRPNDIIPLRMITLGNDLKSLLGVGYDNKLYIKRPNDKGELDLTTVWKLVPNNNNIIYVIYDNDTGYLISVDINGKLFIKSNSDITSNNIELITRLDKPILKLYYDINQYMLIIDTNFQLYQFTELNWKNSELNIQRGANSSLLMDILYDNDGCLYGLVFNTKSYMVQLKKQIQSWYLAEFMDLNILTTGPEKNSSSPSTTENNFVLSDQDIIKLKNGSISEYIKNINNDASIDEDPNIAYQKQLFETRAKLKDFCNSRYSTTSANYENWDMYSNIEKNNVVINDLKNVIGNLLKYEPDKQRIIDNYPILIE